MPLHSLGCGSGALVLTAALTLLLLPAPYLVPDFLSLRDDLDKSTVPNIVEITSPTNRFTFEHLRSHYPPLDLFPNVIMLIIGIVVYLFEWIHRKLMERRILKLRQFLGASMERLRAAELQQAQLEGTLRLARGAASEYNLLLYLLLRRRRAPASSASSPSSPASPPPPTPVKERDDLAFRAAPQLQV